MGKNCKSSTHLYSRLLIMYSSTLAHPLELELTLMATNMVSMTQHSSWLMNRTRLSQTVWKPTHKQWNLSPELSISINSNPPIYTITNNQTVECKITTPVYDKAIPCGRQDKERGGVYCHDPAIRGPVVGCPT